MPCNDSGPKGDPADKYFLNWAGYRSWAHIRRTFEPRNLQELVNAVVDAENVEGAVKAFGSKWSFEPCAVSDGAYIDLKYLNSVLGNWPLQPVWPEPDYMRRILRPIVLNSGIRLVHVEAGIRLHDFILELNQRGLGIATMGASGGQTLAGAFSTGTHGSDIDRPPISDFIHALHMVGPKGQEYWIEPSNGITIPNDDALKANLPNACDDIQIIRDDTIFNAALVSMGRMGIIYAVIIEVKPQYNLEHVRQPWPGGWPAVRMILIQAAVSNNKGFDGTPFSGAVSTQLGVPLEWFRVALGLTSTGPCRHLKINLNPHHRGMAFVQARWETGLGGVSRPTEPPSGGLPGTLIKLINTANDLHLGWLTKIIANKVFEDRQPFHVARSLSHVIMDGGIFVDPESDPPFTVDSAEYFFNAKDTKYLRFLDEMWNLVDDIPFVGGYFSLRFMQGSRATLAMQSWPFTVAIEVSFVHGFPGNNEFFLRMEDLIQEYHPRLHWGQLHMPRPRPSSEWGGSTYRPPGASNEWRTVLDGLHLDSRTFSSEWSRTLNLEPVSFRVWTHGTPLNHSHRRLVNVKRRGFDRIDESPKFLWHWWGRDHTIFWREQAFRGRRIHQFQSGNGPFAVWGGISQPGLPDYFTNQVPDAEWYVEIATKRQTLDNLPAKEWRSSPVDQFNDGVLRLAVRPSTPKSPRQQFEEELLVARIRRFDRRIYTHVSVNDFLDCWAEWRAFLPEFGVASIYFYRVRFRAAAYGRPIPGRIQSFWRRYNSLDSIPAGAKYIFNPHTGVIHRTDVEDTTHLTGMFNNWNALVVPDVVNFDLTNMDRKQLSTLIGSWIQTGDTLGTGGRYVPMRRDFYRLPFGPDWDPKLGGVSTRPPWMAGDVYLPTKQLRERLLSDPIARHIYEEKNVRNVRLCTYCFR